MGHHVPWPLQTSAPCPDRRGTGMSAVRFNTECGSGRMMELCPGGRARGERLSDAVQGGQGGFTEVIPELYSQGQRLPCLGTHAHTFTQTPPSHPCTHTPNSNRVNTLPAHTHTADSRRFRHTGTSHSFSYTHAHTHTHTHTHTQCLGFVPSPRCLYSANQRTPPT